jgi:hypothetical protein
MTDDYILEPDEGETAMSRRYESLGLNPPRLAYTESTRGPIRGYPDRRTQAVLEDCRVCGRPLNLPGYAAIGRHPRCWG